MEEVVIVVDIEEAIEDGIMVDAGEDADFGAEAMAIGGQALPLRLLRWDIRQLDHHHSILLLRSMDVRHVARENFVDG